MVKVYNKVIFFELQSFYGLPHETSQNLHIQKRAAFRNPKIMKSKLNESVLHCESENILNEWRV